MPVKHYFHGQGEKVMRDMMKRYGPEHGKEVFYATANARGLKPSKGGRKGVIKRRPHGSGIMDNTAIRQGYKTLLETGVEPTDWYKKKKKGQGDPYMPYGTHMA